MKICFSTLGCPDWKWNDILAVAKDLGYDGIEVRGLQSEIFAPRAEPFRSNRRAETKAQIEKMGLSLSCLTSFCLLYHEDEAFHYQEGIDYIDLAADLGCPYIRVLGDKAPEPGKNIQVGQVIEMLKRLGDYAGQKGVAVLIETNGIFADSKLLAETLQAVQNPHVGVLWDVQHPVVFYNEAPSTTYERIGEYVKHVHLKDCVVTDNGIEYKMLGYGQLPLKEAIDLLKDNSYTGFLSLEWAKRWYYDLEEPGIVFSHAITRIKSMLEA